MKIITKLSITALLLFPAFANSMEKQSVSPKERDKQIKRLIEQQKNTTSPIEFPEHIEKYLTSYRSQGNEPLSQRIAEWNDFDVSFEQFSKLLKDDYLLDRLRSDKEFRIYFARAAIKLSKEVNTAVQEAEKAASKQVAKERAEKLELKKAVLEEISSKSKEASHLIADMLKDHSKEINKVLKEHIACVHEKSDVEAIKSEEFYQKFITNTTDGIVGLASLASAFGKHREARALFTFGTATLQTINSIRTFAKIGFMTSINPYVGALSAVASLGSFFQDDAGQDGTEAILEAITQGIRYLSQQIYHLHKDMLEQFAEVHRALHKHHRIMLEQFFDLRITLALNQNQVLAKLKSLSKYVEAHHTSIQSSIEALHKNENNNFQMTMSNLNGLRIEEIDDLIERSLLVLQRETVSQKEFCKAIEELYIKAISRASADALTGGAVDLQSPLSLQAALEGTIEQQNIFAHPAFSHINLLSRYVETIASDFKHEKLVNPLIWIKCVEAILYLLNQKIDQDAHYPSSEHIKNLDIDKLIMLKEQGAKILLFIKTLAKDGYIKKVADSYQKCLKELCAVIQEEQAKYEQQCTQDLRKNHQDFINKEKAETARILSSYQNTKCIEYIKEAVKNVKLPKPLFTSSKPYNYSIASRDKVNPNGTKTRFTHVHPGDNELEDFYCLDDTVLHPERCKCILLEYQEPFDKVEHDICSLSVNLSQNEFKQTAECASRWLYPKDRANNLPILTLPETLAGVPFRMPINYLYVRAENMGIGTISYEYSIIDKLFHLEAYFNFKESDRRIKVLHVAKEHDFQKIYDLGENILHFWYGGRYPKDADKFDGLWITRKNESQTQLLDVKLHPINGYYPQIIPHEAARETIMLDFLKNIQKDEAKACEGEIKEAIQQWYAEKRVNFNKEIANQLSSRSITSKLFKAAQDLDVCFRILDSLLTLMYNDIITNDHSAQHNSLITITQESNEKSIKNLAVLTRYVQNYCQKNSVEPLQSKYLPFYIEQTTNKFIKAFSAIMGKNCKPKFKAVTRVIDNIIILIDKYKLRNISPRAITPCEVPEENEQKDNQIALLIEHNKDLAEEARAMKEELSDVKAQLKAVMDLLLEMKNNKN